MSDELKGCPFCGWTATIENDHRGYFGACDRLMSCGVEGPVRETIREATAAWNRRAEEKERRE